MPDLRSRIVPRPHQAEVSNALPIRARVSDMFIFHRHGGEGGGLPVVCGGAEINVYLLGGTKRCISARAAPANQGNV